MECKKNVKNIRIRQILCVQIILSKCNFILHIRYIFTVIGNTLIMLGLTFSSYMFYLEDARCTSTSAKYYTVIRELWCVINHVYTVNYISSEVIITHDYKGGRGRLNPDVCISFLQEPAEMNSRGEHCVTNAWNNLMQ